MKFSFTFGGKPKTDIITGIRFLPCSPPLEPEAVLALQTALQPYRSKVEAAFAVNVALGKESDHRTIAVQFKDGVPKEDHKAAFDALSQAMPKSAPHLGVSMSVVRVMSLESTLAAMARSAAAPFYESRF